MIIQVPDNCQRCHIPFKNDKDYHMVIWPLKDIINAGHAYVCTKCYEEMIRLMNNWLNKR